MPPPALPYRSTPPRPAFTLIELVIVVMILGVMAGVAAPRYQAAITGTELECAVKRLASDLKRARQVAIQTASLRGLEFQPANSLYLALAAGGGAIDDPDHPGTPLEVRFDGPGGRVTLDSTTFPSNQVGFDFRGDPTATGSVVLTSGAASRSVEVNGVGEVLITP